MLQFARFLSGPKDNSLCNLKGKIFHVAPSEGRGFLNDGKKVSNHIPRGFKKSGLYIYQTGFTANPFHCRVVYPCDGDPCHHSEIISESGYRMASYLPTPKSKQPKQQKIPEQPKEPEPQPVPEPPASVPPSPGPSHRGLPEWAKGMLATFGVTLIILAGFLSFAVVRTFIGSGGTNANPFNPPLVSDSTPLPGVTPTALPNAPKYVPWNGVDRVTILAMGLDARDTGPESNSTASRTDTMIVLSLDPVTKTAAMLSIPRDLYVEIPGHGFDKINKAYFYGEVDHMQNIGGTGLAMQTVHNLLGIPIDYYAVVDFNSFTTFVDTIGGIDVYVPFDNMVVDPVGNHNTTTLTFGWNHLDGALALGYARNRHTENGDFDRAARTQQVILAIRDQVLKLNLLPSLLLKAPTLWNQMVTGIKTNLTMDQIIQLALTAKDLKRQNIRQGVIDATDCLAIDTINNESTLIPNLDKVRALRAQVFTSGGVLGYATPPTDLDALAFQENARIEIVNGTGITGLAGATKNFLVSHGFSEANFLPPRDATSEELNSYPLTTLVTDYSGMPYTVRYLYGLMNLSAANIKTNIRLDSKVDVQIFLKYDWEIPQG
jgi:LCP family protein required for cell wall assembly